MPSVRTFTQFLSDYKSVELKGLCKAPNESEILMHILSSTTLMHSWLGFLIPETI